MSLFVNIDGPNGTGKTGLIKKVKSRLETIFDKFRLDEKVYTTSEPGGTEVRNKIRQLLLNPDYDEMDEITETILFFADRAEHYHNFLKEKDGIIITDRYVSSTYVYQHYLKGVSKGVIDDLFRISTDEFIPDLNFLLISDKPHSKDIGDKFEDEKLNSRKKEIQAFVDFFNNDSRFKKFYVLSTNEKKWEQYASFMAKTIYDYYNIKNKYETM